MATKQTVGMGETADEVIGRVSAQVMFLVAEMQPGQVLTVERFEDETEMFRVTRRSASPTGTEELR